MIKQSALALALIAGVTWAAGTKIVGYMPTWAGDINTVPYEKMTHLNYAFAIPEEDGSLRPLDDEQRLLDMMTKARTVNPKIKILISIGGWQDGSNGMLDPRFEEIGADPVKRKKLVDEIVAWVRKYNFDGADIDWEYPDPGVSADRYEIFMKALSDSLRPQKKYLTAAVIGTGSQGAGVKQSVFPLLDFVNLMAYDNQGEDSHSSYEFAQTSLNYWVKLRGLPASKAILGVPFYGNPGYSSYAALMRRDTAAYSKDQVGSTYYNGIPTIQKKTSLAAREGGGIMIWELSQDVLGSKSLLGAISDKMTQMKDTLANMSSSSTSSSSVSGIQGELQKGVDMGGEWLDNMGSPGVNWRGGLWFGDSDYWERVNYNTAGKGKQAVVWDVNKKVDLALGNGTWGDISQGYMLNDATQTPMLATIFEVYAPVKAPESPYNYAGLVMEIEARDCSKNPDACWEIELTGVSADLRNYTAMNVGMSCNVGEKVWLDLVPQVIDFSYPTWGRRVECTGKPEIYTLTFDSLETKYKVDDTVKVPALDLSKVFRLRAYWGSDSGLAASNRIEIHGVTLNKKPGVDAVLSGSKAPWTLRQTGLALQLDLDLRSLMMVDAQGKSVLLKGQGSQWVLPGRIQGPRWFVGTNATGQQWTQMLVLE